MSSDGGKTFSFNDLKEEEFTVKETNWGKKSLLDRRGEEKTTVGKKPTTSGRKKKDDGRNRQLSENSAGGEDGSRTSSKVLVEGCKMIKGVRQDDGGNKPGSGHKRKKSPDTPRRTKRGETYGNARRVRKGKNHPWVQGSKEEVNFF